MYFKPAFIFAFKEDESAIYCEEEMAAQIVSASISSVAWRDQRQVRTLNSDPVA